MSETVSGEELEKINGYARELLTEDKVFVFRVALCDNDIDRDGEKKTPVVLHRAILGSLDRFMAYILEETKGNLPTWLAPVQVKVLPISGWKLCLRKLRQTERSTAGLWQRLTWCEHLLTATL